MVRLYNAYLNSYWAQNNNNNNNNNNSKEKRRSHVVLRGNPKNLSVLFKH